MTQRNLLMKRCLGVLVLSAALFFLAAGFWPPVQAQSTGTLTLTVHVTGARNASCLGVGITSNMTVKCSGLSRANST
jgi:hypothetical protein